MKRLEDFTNAARTIHDRYAASRMDRAIVREWVLGLSSYPEPYDSRIREAAAWFKPSRDGMDPTELKIADLARLHPLFTP